MRICGKRTTRKEVYNELKETLKRFILFQYACAFEENVPQGQEAWEV